MFRNYFKTAWRNMVHTLGYSLLNILGLAAGMAVTLLIGLWVYEQYSYDKFLPEYQSIYRVQRNFNANGDTLTFLTTSPRLAGTLRRDIPEIEYVAKCDWIGEHGLKVGDKKFFLRGAQADTDFLKIFQYPFLEGNAGSAFRDAYSIVLTESTARSLFGNEKAMGKTIRFDNTGTLTVTGILKDIPSNASVSFGYVVPWTYQDQMNPGSKSESERSFSNNRLQIFVKLKPGTSYASLVPKIRNIEHVEKGNINAENSYVTLQPITRWHLYSKYVNGKDTPGFLDYVQMFSLIGLLVLVIACINFINLTTARSEKRAREVGVRKAIGSGRKDLVMQFLMEAGLLTAIAFLFALLISELVLPGFNLLTASHIRIPYANPVFWLVMLACLVIVALLAGSRPAFYLSSFNPVVVLKGRMQSPRSATLSRKILVVLQFTCSIALIIGTVIIYQQIQYARNRPSGYSLNRLMSTNMNDELAKNYDALKNELLQKKIVESITTASSPATDVWWHSDLDRFPGKVGNETVEMGAIIVDPDYFKTLGMQVIAGRNFSSSLDTTSVVCNETAAKRLRLKDPVNQKVTWFGQEFTIVGVVKDALMLSPFQGADPTFFAVGNRNGVMMYRLSPAIGTAQAIEQLTQVFSKYAPAYPYTYSFTDADYGDKFRLELLTGKLAGLFAGLAIFISCLGLFGLAAYVAEQRTKEIGIRKVLGASVQQVWFLLSKEFVILVLISCVLATPLTLYFLKNWLMKYDYRISIGAGVFLLGGLLALLITLVTISVQSIKAALANPVKSLRSE